MKHIKSNSKGAIELSANFIIIIVISSIVVIGGLALFFKMKGNAQQYVDTLDSQTEDNIKSMMLNGGGKVAVYPKDTTITAGGAQMVGIGLTNIYDTQTTFSVGIQNIKLYTKDTPEGVVLSDNIASYYSINSETVEIAPHEQTVKGILLRLPKGAKSGQYVYTILVTNQATSESYGVMQVYVNSQ